MANPFKGEVAFEVGEQSYKLCFSANAIIEMEDHFDKTVEEISNLLRDTDRLRMKNLRAVFWAGLTDHHPGITIKEAGVIITQVGFQRVVELIGLGFSRAFPEVEGEANPPKPDQDGTGPASSTNG
jgi:hypothetical protein